MARTITTAGELYPIATGTQDTISFPIEAFNKANEQLTQAYYQGKQTFNTLNTALKNTPHLDVDESGIDYLNKKATAIHKDFEDISQPDTWQHSQGKLLSLADNITNDETLKTITSNYNNIAANNKTIDDLKIDPIHKTSYKEQNLLAFKQNGGSVDEQGNPIKFNPFLPQTDMDINKYTKQIQDLVTKLTAMKDSGGIKQLAYNIPPEQLAGNDPLLRQALSTLVLDKSSIEHLDLNRIQQLAIQTINADPIADLTFKEVANSNRFMATKKLVPDGDDLKQIFNQLDVSTKKEILKYSPEYNTAFNDLQEQWKTAHINGDKHTEAVLNSKIENLWSDPNYFKLARNNYVNTVSNGESKLGDIVNTLEANRLKQNVIHSTDTFAYHKIDEDLHNIDNHYWDLWKTKHDEEQKEAPNTYNTGLGVTRQLDGTELSNVNQMEQLKALAANGNQAALVQLQLMESKINEATGVATETFNNLTQDEKNKILDETFGRKITTGQQWKDVIGNIFGNPITNQNRDLIYTLNPTDILNMNADDALKKINSKADRTKGWLSTMNGKFKGVVNNDNFKQTFNEIKQRLYQNINTSHPMIINNNMTTIEHFGKPTAQQYMYQSNVRDNLGTGVYQTFNMDGSKSVPVTTEYLKKQGINVGNNQSSNWADNVDFYKNNDMQVKPVNTKTGENVSLVTIIPKNEDNKDKILKPVSFYIKHDPNDPIYNGYVASTMYDSKHIIEHPSTTGFGLKTGYNYTNESKQGSENNILNVANQTGGKLTATDGKPIYIHLKNAENRLLQNPNMPYNFTINSPNGNQSLNTNVIIQKDKSGLYTIHTTTNGKTTTQTMRNPENLQTLYGGMMTGQGSTITNILTKKGW